MLPFGMLRCGMLTFRVVALHRIAFRMFRAGLIHLALLPAGAPGSEETQTCDGKGGNDQSTRVLHGGPLHMKISNSGKGSFATTIRPSLPAGHHTPANAAAHAAAMVLSTLGLLAHGIQRTCSSNY